MRKTLQRGFTLIEILGALAISSIMLVGLSALIDSSMEDAKGQQAALYQAQVVSAASKYIETNYTPLLTSAAGAVTKITLADLQSGAVPYLSPLVAATNAYNQTPCVLVRKNGAGKLDALVVTYGGQVIADKVIGSIAANAGSSSGYINSAEPGIAQGTSWKLDSAGLATFVDGTCLSATATTNAGHLVSGLFFDGPGQLSTNFLYRNKVPGRPELNKMNTPLFLSGTAVANTSESGVCDAATPSTFGAISTDLSGAVLSCESGVWRNQGNRFWKDPVDSYNSLILLPADKNQAGDVRLEKTTNRAFAWNAGTASWVALAVDQNGRLKARDLLLERQVVADTACTVSEPIGSIAIEQGTGVIMSCQSGKWTSQSALHKRTDLSQQATWVILESSQPVSDLPAVWYKFNGPYGYEAASGWSSALVTTNTIQPNKEGLLVANVKSTMDRQQPFSEPLKFPDPIVGGQFEILAWVTDLDTGSSISDPIVSRSGKLRNEAITINATLVQSIPKNINGYVMNFMVRWTTFEASNFYNLSYWGDSYGNTVYQTPLTLAYFVDVNN